MIKLVQNYLSMYKIYSYRAQNLLIIHQNRYYPVGKSGLCQVGYERFLVSACVLELDHEDHKFINKLIISSHHNFSLQKTGIYYDPVRDCSCD